ncbi:MAG: hypothetical protein ABSE21_18500 [Bryobacteraceae bacterium]|jgi:hypothetical protein
MSDDDLVLKPKPKPKWPFDRATLALIISALAVGITAYSAWENRQNRKLAQSAQGPRLEIIAAEFFNESSLMMTLHNVGHAQAMTPRCDYEVYLGESSMLDNTFQKVRAGGGNPIYSFMPDIPIGKEVQAGAGYLPLEANLKQFTNYRPPMIIELRGRISYFDNERNPYYLPYCYQVRGAYGSSTPVASQCVHMMSFGNFSNQLTPP